MPRTPIPVVISDHAGVPLMTAASDPINGHSVANDEKTVVVFVNLTGDTLHATILCPNYQDGTISTGGLRVPDRVITITSGTSVMVGPFPAELFNQPDTLVYIDVDGPLQVIAASIQEG